MTAFDMIREGLAAWNIDFVSNSPARVLLLFITGFAFAGLVSNILGGRRTLKTTTGNKPSGTDNIVEFINLFPFPIWTQQETGESLRNAAYLNLNDPVIQPNANPQKLVDRAGQMNWYNLHKIDGQKLSINYALPANAVIEAENSLKRLMETLSNTFARLPVGLAVFGPDKSLDLFNPGLCDLLQLDAAWLATRPTLTSILEKLRNNNHLPEKKDFISWRRLLTDMESVNVNTDFSEQWDLSSGTILRVTGKKHSLGSTTFLFEDATSEVHSSRLRHSDSNLNQAILDHIPEAIIVLDAAGQPSITNAKFDLLFQSDQMTELGQNTMGNYWGAMSKSPGLFAFEERVRAFVSKSGQRKPWDTILPKPLNKNAHVFPMPDGSTLISFSTPEAGRGSGNLAEFFHITDSMFSIINESTSMSDPLNINGLRDFLKKRNIKLDCTEFSFGSLERTETVKTRRILWYLLLAASNVCRDGGDISLISNSIDRKIRIACSIKQDDILSGQNNHLSLGLLRQLVEQAGGGADWVFDDSALPLTVSCIIPASQPLEEPKVLAGHA